MNYLVVMYQKPTTTLATVPQNSSLSSIYYKFLWKRITTKLRIFNEVKFIKKNKIVCLKKFYLINIFIAMKIIVAISYYSKSSCWNN